MIIRKKDALVWVCMLKSGRPKITMIFEIVIKCVSRNNRKIPGIIISASRGQCVGLQSLQNDYGIIIRKLVLMHL